MSAPHYELIEGDFASFFAAPKHAYGDKSLFVSMMKPDMERWLDAKANPLFADGGGRAFFAVKKDGVPIGRIVAHDHSASNAKYKNKRAYFGFFDCADDQRAASMLLSAAEAWGKSRGHVEIAGNFNLTAMQQIGVVVAGFENQPYSDQVYNPPHVVKLLEGAGYKRFFPMSTFELEVAKAKISEPDAGAAWELRGITRRGLNRVMEDARQVLNDGFADNPMFVPVTGEEFFFQAKDMMWIIDPRISSLAYLDGKPVGVVVCIPDLNPLMKATGGTLGVSTLWHYLRFRMNRRRAVIIYYSVCKAHHGKGLMKHMLHATLKKLTGAGYERVGITWIADENKASLRQMERLGAAKHHSTTLFGKKFT